MRTVLRENRLKSEEKDFKPWFACPGADPDVIVSVRARIARNLANFPFPSNFRGDDARRVQSLVFDAFAQMQGASAESGFHAVETASLDANGRRILEERGVLRALPRRVPPEGVRLPETGVVMSTDGRCSTTVNCGDHIRISFFQSALGIQNAFDGAYRIDSALQERLQFAASYDFGYLTASFRDTGSALKLSARIHIPAAVRFGMLSRITDIAKQSRLCVVPAFPELSQGSAAGNFFTIETTSALNGSEMSQLADFEAACRDIAETERKISTECADNKRTIVRNSVIRAYSIAKFSLLVSLREALDIISDIKFGLRLGMLEGISDDMLCGLLYRIQPGHLFYLLQDGHFSFEDDIARDERAKTDRIRALILQEAFSTISLGNL